MQWNYDIDLSKRKFTSRLIVERALKRNWKVRGFESNAAVFFLYPNLGSKPIRIFSSSPSATSYPASKIAKDKYITNQVLKDGKFPVPDELLINTSQVINNEQLKIFLKHHGQIVVKPLDASHGNGITTGISTLTRLREAITEASQQSNKVLIQEQVDGFDVRIVCMGYKFCDAITRIPASIIGDGKHTIEKLVEIENTHKDRGENYQTKLNRIPLGKAKQFLEGEVWGSIPSKGQCVQVIGVSNIGMGGIRMNIKEQIPKFLISMAEQIAEYMELAVCGVDFMVKSLPTARSTAKELDPKVIEVNECPMLTMYDDLHSAEQDKIIDKYLDYIESMS